MGKLIQFNIYKALFSEQIEDRAMYNVQCAVYYLKI